MKMLVLGSIPRSDSFIFFCVILRVEVMNR